jgi:hypothetical protein
MVKVEDNTYKQIALLFSIAEDCHVQHALNIEGERRAGV